MKSLLFLLVIVVALVGVVVLDIVIQDVVLNNDDSTPTDSKLLPASATMVTAWDVPQNPLTDSTLDTSPLAKQIRWGFKLFTETRREAPALSRGSLSCNNCHLNGGQKEKAMPLVGVAVIFPEYNKRSGRLFSLEDRIVGCFERSQNGTGGRPRDSIGATPSSPEVLAISAYITWISRGFALGSNPPWRGHNVIAQDKLIPVSRLDTALGRALFMEKCSACHGEDGQGVAIGDKKAGPLWGVDSWNDGAGAARVYTLAGMIRYAMPYLSPGSLTDEEALLIAAFINSKPRPAYPFKEDDYRTEKIPVDAVYYKR